MERELSSTLEDYLEAIFRLERNKRAARVRDIAKHVGVKTSTVSAALKSLAGKQLVMYQPYELIALTPKGREKARTIVMHHHVIRHFLQDVLALSRERADRIACEFEHAVDGEIIERFLCFLTFAERFAVHGSDLLGAFRRFLRESSEDLSCRNLIREYAERLEAAIEAEVQAR